MAATKKLVDRPTRYNKRWFDVLISEMKDPKHDQFARIQMIIEHLVQRIEWLEKEVDARRQKS